MDRKQLERLMKTKMDRREFLRYLAVLSVGMIGLGRIIDFLQKPLSKSKDYRTKKQSGYGSSPYGQ